MIDVVDGFLMRVGPVREAALDDAAVDRVELGFGDEERVVLLRNSPGW